MWTRLEKGLAPRGDEPAYEEVEPTSAHMGLVSLVSAGMVHHVVSQNTDGLHLRSGLNPRMLSELHGNTYIEQCPQCKRRYLRDFEVDGDEDTSPRETGGICTDCKGKLVDFQVSFGDELPARELKLATAKSEAADLSICFGTSLSVDPAASLPFLARKGGRSHGKGSITGGGGGGGGKAATTSPSTAAAAAGGSSSGRGRVVIVSLEPTAEDERADVALRADCNMVISCLVKELGLAVKPYSIASDGILALIEGGTFQ